MAAILMRYTSFIGILALLAGIAFSAMSAEPLLWPLPSSRFVTGGFADTRPSHFHGGVDLRAQTPEPVIAPSDGWVERLSVNPSGYGHALYYRLADGRTAVFGHLSLFAPPVEQALRDSQLVSGRSHIEIVYPDTCAVLKFRRGDTLAFTGKTGIGPAHLHFEVRDGAVQTDPLANFDPLDTQKPVITGLWWTTWSGYSPGAIGYKLVRSQSGDQWRTLGRRGILAQEPVAFFIQTYDPGPWGRNAVPSIIRLRVNGDVVREAFPGRIDLAAPKTYFGDIASAGRGRNRREIRRLFMPPPPAKYAFSLTPSDGWLADLTDATVTIEVVDRAGNTTAAAVTVTSGPTPDGSLTLPSVLNAGDFTLSGNNMSVAWASLTATSTLEVCVSPGTLAFARPCTLSYRCAPEKRKGLYFYERDSRGGRRSMWAIAAPDSAPVISCTILHGGTYGVARDTIPPNVTFSVFGGRVRYSVGDNASGVDDGALRCMVDGVTAVPDFEYNLQRNFIWTRAPLSRGRHDVQMTAGDRAGNVRTWTATVRIP